MGEAQAANNLADAYQRLERTDEALDLYRHALELNRQIGYRLGEGIALGSLGWTLLDLDRPGEAIDYLQEAQDAFEEIGYADGTGYALHILGRCYLSLGRTADARDCLQRALASHRATGNRRMQATTLKSLGAAQHRAAWPPRRASRGLRPPPSSGAWATGPRRPKSRPRWTLRASAEIPETIMPGRYDAGRLPRISFGGRGERGSSWVLPPWPRSCRAATSSTSLPARRERASAEDDDDEDDQDEGDEGDEAGEGDAEPRGIPHP